MWDSKRDTDVLNSLLDSVGEGEGRMIWENGIETCKLSYVKWIASPRLMYETGCSGLVSLDDPEGWDEKGRGRGIQDGNTCTPMEDSSQCMAKPVQYCKLKCKKKKRERDAGLIPGLGRSHGEGNGNPLQHSYPENPMDRGAWRAIVHGVTWVRHEWATLTHSLSLPMEISQTSNNSENCWPLSPQILMLPCSFFPLLWH